MEVRETGYQCLTVLLFEFLEFTSIHEPFDDFANVVGLAGVARHDPDQFIGIQGRFARFPER